MLVHGLLRHQSSRGLDCPGRFRIHLDFVDDNPLLLIGKNRAAGQMGVLVPTLPRGNTYSGWHRYIHFHLSFELPGMNALLRHYECSVLSVKFFTETCTSRKLEDRVLICGSDHRSGRQEHIVRSSAWRRWENTDT